MSYIVIMLLLFSVILLIKNYKSKVTWFFLLMMFGLELSILLTIVYIAKFGQYPYPREILFTADYSLYLLLHGVRIEYSELISLLNFGICLYVVMVPVFVHNYTSTKMSNSKFSFIKTFIVLMILPVLSLCLYKSEVAFKIYKTYFSIPSTEVRGTFLLTLFLIETLDMIWKILYLLIPIITMFRCYRSTNLKIKKKQIVSITLCLLILNILYMFLFVIDNLAPIYVVCKKISFANIVFDQQSMQLIVKKIPGINLLFENNISLIRNISIASYCYTVLPLIVLFMVAIMIFAMIRYRGVDNVDIFKQISIKKNVKSVNKNLRGVFHSFKNILFSIDAMLKMYEFSDDEEKKKQIIADLQTVVTKYLDSVSNMMDKTKEVGVAPVEIDAVKIVNMAIDKTVIPPDVRLLRNYHSDDISIYVDEFCMVNALQNIIKNAVEAVGAVRDDRQRTINIELFAEGEWAVLKVKDNGIGIDKKDYNNIFKEFYTSKSRNKDNWGVGLSYVYRVIKKHLGYISVESAIGQGSTFQIMLPRKEISYAKNKSYGSRRL